MAWNNQRESKVFKNMTVLPVRCRTTNIMLGTMPGNPDLFRDFIASKAPDAKSREEEVALSGIDKVVDKSITVFPIGRFFKTPDNIFFDPVYDVVPEGIEGEYVDVPFIWDYQWKGSFKEAIAMLSKAAGGKKKAPKKSKGEVAEASPVEEGSGNNFASSKITAYKKVVDGNWFVKQRRIPLLVPETYIDDMGNTYNTYDENGRLRIFTRQLRADTAQGPRVTIAASEFVPAGTEFYFTILLMNPADKEALLETLDYKQKFGMLQWRGGGKGTLIWTPATEDGVPVDIDL